MMYLAIETSSKTGSVAVLRGRELLAIRRCTPDRGHGRHWLREVHEALLAAELEPDAIDVYIANTGPGSFTGVRIGLSAARALAWSTGKLVAGADGMLALAQSACVREAEWVSPVLDARKGELYCALFHRQNGTLKPVLHAAAMTPQRWVETAQRETAGQPVVFVGDGVSLLPSELRSPENIVPIDAYELALAAIRHHEEHGEWLAAIPRYVRPAEAEVKFGMAPEHTPLEHVVRADAYPSAPRSVSPGE